MNQYPQGPEQPYPSNPGYPPQGQPYQQPPTYHPMPPQQPMQPQKKKGKLLWIILGCVGALVLCGVIANTSKTSTTTQTSSFTTTSPGSSSSSTQQAPAKTWQTTHTYSGNGNQQTETFTVGDDWKIQWSCQADDAPLYVSIYNADTKEMTDWSAVSTTCKNTKTTGETAEHTGGNIYLSIISGIDWKITVLELK